MPQPTSTRIQRQMGFRLLCGTALSVAVFTPAVSAQPGVALNGPKVVGEADPVERINDPARLREVFDQIVRDLASNDFAVRLKASERLAANEQFDLPMLESALKRSELTLEAKSRLLSAARARFFRSPRAALGFQFGLHLRDRIVVGKTFDKFPSARLLEEGDMIVGADGFKLEGPGARFLIQSVIVSHDPGEIIHLTIRRGERKLDIDVPLGRFVDLDQGGGAAIMEDRLSKAWRIRAQARLGATAEPIRVDVPADKWGPGDEPLQRRMDAFRQREANAPALKIVGGGMPRSARSVDEAHAFEQVVRQQIVWINGQVRVMNMAGFRGGFMGDADPDLNLPPIPVQQELAQLLEARMALEKQGEASRSLPANQKELEVIIRQEKAIQAELAEMRAATGNNGKTSAADANDRGSP